MSKFKLSLNVPSIRHSEASTVDPEGTGDKITPNKNNWGKRIFLSPKRQQEALKFIDLHVQLHKFSCGYIGIGPSVGV